MNESLLSAQREGYLNHQLGCPLNYKGKMCGCGFNAWLMERVDEGELPCPVDHAERRVMGMKRCYFCDADLAPPGSGEVTG